MYIYIYKTHRLKHIKLGYVIIRITSDVQVRLHILTFIAPNTLSQLTAHFSHTEIFIYIYVFISIYLYLYIYVYSACRQGEINSVSSYSDANSCDNIVNI